MLPMQEVASHTCSVKWNSNNHLKSSDVSVCLVSVVWFRWTFAHRKMIRICGLFWLVLKFVSMNSFLLQFIAWCSFIVIGQKFYIHSLHINCDFFFFHWRNIFKFLFSVPTWRIIAILLVNLCFYFNTINFK